MLQIYVDADACPVKEEVAKVAARYGVKVYLVANSGMRPSRDPLIEHVLVSGKFDAADDWIADRAAKGDLVVTADIPLAARCLDNECNVIKPNGKEFSQQNIGSALVGRDISQHLREANQTQTRNPPFESKDRAKFLQTMDRILQRVLRSRKPD